MSLAPLSRQSADTRADAAPLGVLRPEHTPQGGLKYWLALSAASVLGCNTGDLFSSAFDIAAGLPLLAAGFGATLLAERNVRRPTQAFYWTAIILVRTAATNIADFLGHLAGGGFVLAGLAAALGATLWARNVKGAPAGALPKVDALYWTQMLIAGTLGTALGDMASFMTGLGLGGASLALGGLVAALVAARSLGWLASTASFWGTVVAIRAAGTSFGDFSANHLGLAASAVVSVLTLATLVFFRSKPRPRLAGPVAALA